MNTAFNIPEVAHLTNLPYALQQRSIISLSWMMEVLTGQKDVGPLSVIGLYQIPGIRMSWYGVKKGATSPIGGFYNSIPSKGDQVEGLPKDVVLAIFDKILEGVTDTAKGVGVNPNEQVVIAGIQPNQVHLLMYLIECNTSNVVVTYDNGRIMVTPEAPTVENTEPVAEVAADLNKKVAVPESPEPMESSCNFLMITGDDRVRQAAHKAVLLHNIASLLSDTELSDAEIMSAARKALLMRKAASLPIILVGSKHETEQNSGASRPTGHSVVTKTHIADSLPKPGALASRIQSLIQTQDEILYLVFDAVDFSKQDLQGAVEDLKNAGWFMFYWYDKKQDKWVIKAVNTSLWDVQKISSAHSSRLNSIKNNGGKEIGKIPGTSFMVVVTKKEKGGVSVAA